MARGSGPVQNTIGANPYPVAKENVPYFTECELCKRKIPTKNWPEHKVSKKHRAEEDKERRGKDNVNENIDPTPGFGGFGDGFGDSFGGGPVGGEPWGAASYEGQVDGRRSPGSGARGGGGRACFGCGQEGHNKRDCPNGGSGGGNACFNCGEEGHRKSECPKGYGGGGGGGDRACFNCGMTGHRKADCPSGPSSRRGNGGGQQCFNCFKTGHRKSECTEERVIKCRNCDDIGHESRECTKPKDWSRVQCNNCKEFGHTVKRCKVPVAEDTNGGGWGDSGAAAGASAGNWANNDEPAAASGWGDDAAGASNDWADASADAGW